MWAKIITIKRTKDLNYFSLCALNLFNTRVSQLELNYWNKWTVSRHSNLLRCTCIYCLYMKQYAVSSIQLFCCHILRVFSYHFAINMRSVWTAWFQFWGKQHLLHIDVLFFPQYFECAALHRVGSTGQAKNKSIKMQRHLVIACCLLKSKIRMQRFAFQCGFLC